MQGLGFGDIFLASRQMGPYGFRVRGLGTLDPTP